MSYCITQDCIGCTLCKRSCPVQAIDGELKNIHHINDKRCVECGVCGNVCPKGAILDQDGKKAEKIPKENWKRPVIDTAACSACSVCVDICGKDCLQISLPKFRGDIQAHAYLAVEKDCVSCGLCASYCPLHAIRMEVRR